MAEDKKELNADELDNVAGGARFRPVLRAKEDANGFLQANVNAEGSLLKAVDAIKPNITNTENKAVDEAKISSKIF